MYSEHTLTPTLATAREHTSSRIAQSAGPCRVGVSVCARTHPPVTSFPSPYCTLATLTNWRSLAPPPPTASSNDSW